MICLLCLWRLPQTPQTYAKYIQNTYANHAAKRVRTCLSTPGSQHQQQNTLTRPGTDLSATCLDPDFRELSPVNKSGGKTIRYRDWVSCDVGSLDILFFKLHWDRLAVISETASFLFPPIFFFYFCLLPRSCWESNRFGAFPKPQHTLAVFCNNVLQTIPRANNFHIYSLRMKHLHNTQYHSIMFHL